MKVLQLCNKAPYPPRDGGALASWNLAQGLVENGEQVTLLFMNTSKHRVSESLIPENPESSIQYIGVPVNTDIRPLAAAWNLLFSRLPYNLFRFKSHAFNDRLEQLLSRQHFDAVIFDGLPATIYLPLFQKFTKLLKLLRTHNVEYNIWKGLGQAESSLPKKWYLKHLARRIKKFEMESIKKMDALLPITRQDMEYFQKEGFPGPFHLFPFGIDPEDYKPKEEKHHISPDLLFLGALDWKPNIKGLQWFIDEVWPSVHQKFPDIFFHIAGRNPGNNSELFKNQPSIKFYGEIEETDTFLTRGDLLLVPLFTGSGMRVKIIEAMARGLIVITTTLGLEGIDAKPGEQVVIANTATSFITQLERLLNDHQWCLKISHEAREFVQVNFNNFTLTKNLIGFIKSLSQ